MGFDTVEVWGSSPHVPTISFNNLAAFRRGSLGSKWLHWPAPLYLQDGGDSLSVVRVADYPDKWLPTSEE